MGKRRTYSNEMKEESVQYLLSHPEKTITAVAESLGIRRDVLNRWKQEKLKHNEKSFPGKGNPRDEELFKLKRELADTKEERDILKKALAIFSKGQK
jgi:transposase